MTLVPPEDVVPGAAGLLGDPNLMAKLEDVAMVQVSVPTTYWLGIWIN